MTSTKLHVKKGDKVLVLSGKDKGKKGKIIATNPTKSSVTVEGINIVKKHAKATKNVQAGIHEREAPLHSSKVMAICPSCQKTARVKKSVEKDGSRSRVCRHCGDSLDK